MKIHNIISFLVPPGKHDESSATPKGTDIPLSGGLYAMLKEIFDRSQDECTIPICFRPCEDGKQQNDCRDEIVHLIKKNSLDNAEKLAVRLMKCSTNKSGLGLLFLIIGKDDKGYKVMISRFPAEQGIMAEENRKTLSVTFIERVFMKNAHSYKSALYSGSSFDSHFWEGFAIDRQIASGVRELSNYWIKDFLVSDFKTTPKEGTRRLALALKNAINHAEDIRVKEELLSSAVLASNLQSQAISIGGFCEKFSLSGEAKQLILQQLGREELADARFLFDKEEFDRHALYKSVELDNGGTLIAPTNKFDGCFNPKMIDAKTQRVSFTTEGKIVNAKLRRRN